MPVPSRVPELTVVIPAFNASATIGASVDSASHLGDVRVVVVDDGSSDETAAVAERHGAEVIRQENMGPSAARRRGLDGVRTEFVVFLDADDELMPGMVEVIGALGKSTGLAVVGGRAQFRGASGRALSNWTTDRPERLSTHDLLTRAHAPWPPSAAAWRTDSVRQAERIEPAPLHPRYAEDFELLVRASLVGGVGHVAVVSCLYSADGGRSMTNAAAEVEDSERIRRYYGGALDLPLRYLSQRQILDQAAWRRFFATREPRHPVRLARYAMTALLRRLLASGRR